MAHGNGYDSATAYPDDFVEGRSRRLSMIDLGVLDGGRLVVARTKRGSTWYLTPLHRRYTTATEVMGISIQTDSDRHGQRLTTPATTRVNRHIEVGDYVYINGRRASGEITSVGFE